MVKMCSCNVLEQSAVALQLEDNLKAIEFVPKLTPEIIEKIEKVIKSKPEPASTYGR